MKKNPILNSYFHFPQQNRKLYPADINLRCIVWLYRPYIKNLIYHNFPLTMWIGGLISNAFGVQQALVVHLLTLLSIRSRLKSTLHESVEWLGAHHYLTQPQYCYWEKSGENSDNTVCVAFSSPKIGEI